MAGGFVITVIGDFCLIGSEGDEALDLVGGHGRELAFQGAELLPNPIPITPGTMTDSGFCLFVSDIRCVYLAYLQSTLSPVNWKAVSYFNANARHVHTI